jgi:hypothetical protein
VPFSDEPTRQVDDELLSALRNAAPAKAAPRPGLPKPSRPADEPGRLAPVTLSFGDEGDDLTRPSDDFGAPRFLSPAPSTDPMAPGGLGYDDVPEFDEATKLARLDGSTSDRGRHHGLPNDERTRSVNIRNDPSISDIDWDLD